MTRVLTTIDEHPRLITAILGAAILLFLAACERVEKLRAGSTEIPSE